MAYKTSFSATGNSGQPAITIPASSVAAGDVVVLACTADNQAWTLASFTPTGFTSFREDDLTGDGQSSQYMWKRATGADTGTYTYSSSIGSAADWIVVAVVLSGRHATDPAAISTAALNNAANANPVTVTANGVTAVAGDDLIMVSAPDVRAANVGNGHSAWPAGFTSRHDIKNAWVNLGVATRENVSAGATGNLAATFNLTSGSAGWAAALIRVPAAAGGGTNASPSSPAATAIGDLVDPSLSAGSNATNPAATAVGALPGPVASGQTWQNISGATGGTYSPASGDIGSQLRCVVTATNPAGSASATSNVTSAVTGSAGSVTAPVADGVGALPAPQVSNGTWTNIPAATSSAYPLQAGDLGASVRCVVTATNPAGSVSANSNQAGPVTAAAAGQTVTAPPMSGTGDIPTPSLPVSMEVASGALLATGDLPDPTVTGATNQNVTAPAATSTGDVPNPAITAGSGATAPPLDGAGALPGPSVGASSAGTVGSVPLDAVGALPAPSVRAGVSVGAPALDGVGDIATPRVGDPFVLPEMTEVGFEPGVPAFSTVGFTGIRELATEEPTVPGFMVAAPELVYA